MMEETLVVTTVGGTSWSLLCQSAASCPGLLRESRFARLGARQRPLAPAHPEAMGKAVVRSCLQRPSPLEGDPSVISWKDLSFQLFLLTPSQLFSSGCGRKQQPACSCQISTCLPSALLMFWVSPLGTRCMSDHMSRNFKLYGLHKLFIILQITVINRD